MNILYCKKENNEEYSVIGTIHNAISPDMQNEYWNWLKQHVIETVKDVDIDEVRNILSKSKGVKLMDNIKLATHTIKVFAIIGTI